MERILIVDDEKWICAILQDYLKEEGYEVDVAMNLETARKHLSSETLPHLLILDARLPDGSGKDYHQELRLSPRTQSLPVIILSADDPDKTLFKNKLADDYVTKPFSLADLKVRIENLLSHSAKGSKADPAV